MPTLDIDIETYSSYSLAKSGVYKYVQAPDFTILLLAYSFDDEPIEIIDLTKEEIPVLVITDLVIPSITKIAHNANFERVCLQQYLKLKLPPAQWQCTMARASMLSLPLSLDIAAKVLKLPEQKSPDGKALIRYFTMPCKPTKANGGRTRNLPEHDPEKWERFKLYCPQDVRVEQGIRNKTFSYPITDTEKKLWYLDQNINDRGILLDPEFTKNAIQMNSIHREKLTREAITLTGLDNPNSVAQLKEWLFDQTGDEVPTLNKDVLPELLKKTDCVVVKKVLGIRQQMAKSSIKKYTAMQNAMCSDNRVRGLLQYYGANRTGRWAGRLVQVQNLPKSYLGDLDLARQLVKKGDSEMVDLLFGNIPDTLSQLIRTAFIAPEGYRFIVADFASIEARVISWLAGEKWKLDVFKTHGKIYEAAGAHMFKVPIENITKGSKLRDKAKIAELALGFQGGPDALIKMGALRMGLTEEELPKLVAIWRNANQKIVQYWNQIGEAAMEVIETPRRVAYPIGPIYMSMEKGVFFIELPSGRKLCYLKPRIAENRFGFDGIYYEGMDQTTKKWGWQQTYGGKLVENIVQAIARDCLADAMLRLTDAGYKIVMHVHDEVVIETEKDCTKEVNKIMSEPIKWAPGLPLAAESYETFYYKKE